MRASATIVILMLCASATWGALPTDRSLSNFFDDLNTPFAVTVHGCTFSSSIPLGGIPHFNVDAGVTSTGTIIIDPETETETQPTLSIFHVRGTAGLLKGFSPASAWDGLFGLDVGMRTFFSPLFGDIGRNKDGLPYGLGGLAKIGLLRGRETIPSLSVSVEYTYLFNGSFEYHDYDIQEHAHSAFTQSTFSYHVDMLTQLNLVSIHAGIGWLSPKLEAEYTIAGVEHTHETESATLLKYYGGLSVPVDLVDVSVELGQADQNTFFGIGVGLRM